MVFSSDEFSSDLFNLSLFEIYTEAGIVCRVAGLSNRYPAS